MKRNDNITETICMFIYSLSIVILIMKNHNWNIAFLSNSNLVILAAIIVTPVFLWIIKDKDNHISRYSVGKKIFNVLFLIVSVAAIVIGIVGDGAEFGLVFLVGVVAFLREILCFINK